MTSRMNLVTEQAAGRAVDDATSTTANDARASPLDEISEGNFTKRPPPRREVQAGRNAQGRVGFWENVTYLPAPANVQALRQLTDDGSNGARWAGRTQL